MDREFPLFHSHFYKIEFYNVLFLLFLDFEIFVFCHTGLSGERVLTNI